MVLVVVVVAATVGVRNLARLPRSVGGLGGFAQTVRKCSVSLQSAASAQPHASHNHHHHHLHHHLELTEELTEELKDELMEELIEVADSGRPQRCKAQ